jgi:hypothetical protein
MNAIPKLHRANRIYPPQVPALLTRLESLGLLFLMRFQNLDSSNNILPTIHDAIWHHMITHNLNILPRTRTEYTSLANSPFIFLKPSRRTTDDARVLNDMDAIHPPSYSGVSELLGMNDTRVDEGGKRLLWIC